MLRSHEDDVVEDDEHAVVEVHDEQESVYPDGNNPVGMEVEED